MQQPSTKRRPHHFAVLMVLLAAAFACFLTATLPFTTVRGHLDSVAGDGAADPYTPQLHSRVRIYFIGLGLGFVAACAWLRALACGTAAGQSLLSRTRDDCRQLRIDATAFVRAHARPLAALTFAALLIRLPWIDQPIRYDEAHSFIHYANRPAYVTISTYAEPNNHVFHNVCVHVVTRLFGHDEWVLRLPALIAGVLIVPATYALAFLWGGRRLGRLAALAVAVSSPLIEYSVNARGYSLVCLLTLCLLVLAHASLRRSNIAVWATMSVLAAFGLWTVPTMLYACLLVVVWLIAAHMVAGRPQSQVWRQGLLGCAAATAAGTALLYSPILIVEGPLALMSAGMPARSGGHDVAAEVGHSLTQTTQLLLRDLPWPALLLLAAGWLLALRPSLAKPNPAPALLLPAIGACLLLVLMQRVFPPPRTWLFLLPPLYCGALWGVSASVAGSRPAVRSTTLAATVMLVVVWPLIHIVRHDSIRRSPEGGLCPDARPAIEWLQSNLLPGEPIVATTPCSAPLVYYALRLGLPLEHFDRPDGLATRAESAIVVVPTAQGARVAPENVLRELQLEEMFAAARFELVQEIGSAKLFRVVPQDSSR